jgi:hypothetical protein
MTIDTSRKYGPQYGRMLSPWDSAVKMARGPGSGVPEASVSTRLQASCSWYAETRM